MLEQLVSYFRSCKYSKRPGKHGPQYRVHCSGSGHKRGDKTASLDITLGRSGAILLNCKSLGCSIEDILGGVGLTKGNLYENDGKGELDRAQQAGWALRSLLLPLSQLARIVYLYCQDIAAGKPFDEGRLQGHLAKLGEISAKLGRDREARDIFGRVQSLINFTRQCITKGPNSGRLLLTAIFNLAIFIVGKHDAKRF